MLEGRLGRRAAARRSIEESDLNEIRLDHLLDRVFVFVDRRRDGPEPDRSAAELLDDRQQELRVGLVETERVDLESIEGLVGDLRSHPAVVEHLGNVAYAPQKTIRDPWRTARAARDLDGTVVVDVDAENVRRAFDDDFEL